jgi:hypothetical protein
MRSALLLAAVTLSALAPISGCGGAPAIDASGPEGAAPPSSALPSSSAPALTQVPSASASAVAAAPKARPHHAYFDEAGRQGRCEFVKFEGRGKDRKVLFKITPPAGKEVKNLQTWLFYYDKEGKHLERYPHATFPNGENQALGEDGDQIPKGTATVECEITRIAFADQSFWFNANLVRNEEDRPKGGYPESELKTHVGEKVSVEVLDAKAGKLRLKNLSDKPVSSVSVDLIPFKADGTHGWFPDGHVTAEMKPGESVEATMRISGTLPEYTTIEATAPEVRFEDGTTFINHNLSGFELP